MTTTCLGQDVFLVQIKTGFQVIVQVVEPPPKGARQVLSDELRVSLKGHYADATPFFRSRYWYSVSLLMPYSLANPERFFPPRSLS